MSSIAKTAFGSKMKKHKPRAALAAARHQDAKLNAPKMKASTFCAKTKKYKPRRPGCGAALAAALLPRQPLHRRASRPRGTEASTEPDGYGAAISAKAPSLDQEP